MAASALAGKATDLTNEEIRQFFKNRNKRLTEQDLANIVKLAGGESVVDGGLSAQNNHTRSTRVGQNTSLPGVNKDVRAKSASRTNNLNPRPQVATSSSAPILPVSITLKHPLNNPDKTSLEALATWIKSAAPQNCNIDNIRRGRSKDQLLIWGSAERDFAVLMNGENWVDKSVTPWLPERNTIPSTAVILGVDVEITEETINEKLKTDGFKVAIVKRLKRGVEGTPSRNIKVILYSQDDRDKLKKEGFRIFYQRHKVEEYRAPQRVIQCYNCQAYGHVANACAETQKCLRCGETGHGHKSCQLPRDDVNVQCANCHDKHSANSLHCPVRKAFISRTPATNREEESRKSYAEATATATLPIKPQVPHLDNNCIIGLLSVMAEALMKMVNLSMQSGIEIQHKVANEIVVEAASNHLGKNFISGMLLARDHPNDSSIHETHFGSPKDRSLGTHPDAEFGDPQRSVTAVLGGFFNPPRPSTPLTALQPIPQHAAMETIETPELASDPKFVTIR
jgi:hypothetical protein